MSEQRRGWSLMAYDRNLCMACPDARKEGISSPVIMVIRTIKIPDNVEAGVIEIMPPLMEAGGAA